MWTFDQDLAARNQLLEKVVLLLCNQKYVELEQLSKGNRLSALQIEQSVLSYGKTLEQLPTSAVERIDYIAVVGSKPMRWSVVVPLYTVEEGESDLSLEATLVERAQYDYAIEIDNIHVR